MNEANEEIIQEGVHEDDSLYDEENIIPEQAGDTAIIFQLSSRSILERLKRNLRGDEYDYVKKRWIIQTDSEKRNINDLGLSKLMKELDGRVNRNTYLSNLTGEDIHVMSRDLHIHLICLLILNYEEWGIKKDDIVPILYLMMDTVFTTLKRALDKTTLNYMKSQIQFTELSKPQEAQSGRSMLNPRRWM